MILAACGKTQDDTTTPLGVGDSGSPAEPEDTADGDDDIAPEPATRAPTRAVPQTSCQTPPRHSATACSDAVMATLRPGSSRLGETTLVADRAADAAECPVESDTSLKPSPVDGSYVAGGHRSERGGEVALDRDGAAACLDELRTADCGETLRDASSIGPASRSLRPRAEKSSDA